MRISVLAAAMAVAGAAPVVAQEQAQPPLETKPVSVMVAGQQATMLRAGTPIILKTMAELTTKGKHLKVGDKFGLEVAEAVMLNGQVAIPVGASAVGEVTSIRNKGMWGKSGNIETQLLYVTANDRRIRISGSVGDKGVKAGGGAIATSAIVFLPAGFFMTGTSAVVPLGTKVAGLIDEDVAVAFGAPAPAPMVVPVAVPAAAPAATTVAAVAAVGTR